MINRNLNTKFKVIAGLSFVFFFSYLIKYTRDHSQYFMPNEYKTIKSIVNEIASKNYLGDEEITFSIGSGAYMEYRAQELGICKEENCYYLKNLDPYKKYKNLDNLNLNELHNQSYLYNGIEAYAWNGVVWISKSSFNTYGNNFAFLGCTIGHELSHIVHSDHLEQSIKLSNRIKNSREVSNEKKELIRMEFNRESESKADHNGAKMIINAGYPKETCLEELSFIAEKNSWKVDTDENDTHPGYLDRYESLKEFIDNYDKSVELEGFVPYKWEWKYDRNLNSLIFSPIIK